MSNKNNGVSLIEVIIVIAILAILSTGTFISISRIGYANMVKATKSIDSTISKLRLETMSKEEKQYLYLYNIDESIYMKVSTNVLATAAGLDIATGKKVAVKSFLYYKRTTGIRTLLVNHATICISFERGSGAFSAASDYEYIELNHSNNTAVIQCIKETGRHWVE